MENYNNFSLAYLYLKRTSLTQVPVYPSDCTFLTEGKW